MSCHDVARVARYLAQIMVGNRSLVQYSMSTRACDKGRRLQGHSLGYGRQQRHLRRHMSRLLNLHITSCLYHRQWQRSASDALAYSSWPWQRPYGLQHVLDGRRNPRIVALTNPGDASQDLLDDSKAKVQDTGWLQVLSWNPRHVPGDDPGKVASRTCGPWHVICLREEAEFANHPDLRRRFHVVATTGCRNFDDPILVPARGHSVWALEGMVVKEWLTRPVHHGCEYFTVF